MTSQPRTPGRILASCMLLLCIAGAARAHEGPGVHTEWIDSLWPYHAFLVSAGCVLIFSGMVLARRKKDGWFPRHRRIAVAGGILSVAGLAAAAVMVSLATMPHPEYGHGIFGAVTIVLILATVGVGIARERETWARKNLRSTHIWLGRISLAFVALNIVFGPAMLQQV